MSFVRIYLLLLFFITITSTDLASPLLDIKSIAGKNEKQVQTILGVPNSTEKTKQGPKLTFKDKTVEIIFINGKADWITFTPKEIISFNKEALSQLGIALSEPTFRNSNVIRWEPCDKYISVSLFPASGKTDYVYIKVATK